MAVIRIAHAACLDEIVILQTAILVGDGLVGLAPFSMVAHSLSSFSYLKKALSVEIFIFPIMATGILWMVFPQQMVLIARPSQAWLGT